ncbi:hypothetical protein NFI96_006320 [Prochilodus magdalenae]|nr:hypothetical protein NFI96_006320 [Prochilodus magdalenae]
MKEKKKKSKKEKNMCRIDCDFEDGLCSWNQVLTDVFDWTRQSGSTPTLMTGPSFDHTTGSGHYVYIEGDTATHGDTARLLSDECSNPQPQCLQFWYHMYGTSWTMGLSVYLLQGNLAREVWRQRENQGNTWHRGLVDIAPQDNFRIIFEGRIGDDARSDVAVDDVTLHSGTCDGPPQDHHRAGSMWVVDHSQPCSDTDVVVVVLVCVVLVFGKRRDSFASPGGDHSRSPKQRHNYYNCRYHHFADHYHNHNHNQSYHNHNQACPDCNNNNTKLPKANNHSSFWRLQQ